MYNRDTPVHANKCLFFLLQSEDHDVKRGNLDVFLKIKKLSP